MNENSPAPRTKIPRWQALRSLIAISGVCLLLVSLLFAANTKGRSSTTAPRAAACPPRILMIGDSLTVGPFGGAIYNYLAEHYGANNVFVYGSCGSSPEHWLSDEPTFITPCGLRVNHAVAEAKHRRSPTPKLRDLIRQTKPSVVIIQLGTNWMDIVAKPAGKHPDYPSIIDRLVAAARAGRPRQIIWVTPPDSSHFSKGTQRTVENYIRSAAQRDDFTTIRSSGMTHYVPGKTGGDGIHYNDQAGTEWANRVASSLGTLR